MHPRFRPVDTSNAAEIRFIAETDSSVPPLYDADFRNDEDTVLRGIEFLTTKVQFDDFFEVAINLENKIVGFHLVRKVPYLRELFAGAVYTLWVDPEYRKQGIGTTLKQRAEAWAREKDLDHIYTWINSKNKPSLQLNEELGYEITNYKLRKKL